MSTGGEEVDVKFSNTNPPSFAVNRASARSLIALLNGPAGSQIEFIWVTYSRTSEFWDEIKNAELTDHSRVIPADVVQRVDNGGKLNTGEGRIRYWTGHTTHFHIHWR